MRKAIALSSSAAMLTVGLAVGLGAGVASADAPFANPACKLANSKSVDLGVVAPTFNVTKSVDGAGEVAPDGLVTYTTVVSTGFALVSGLESMTDVHPAGFTLQKAEVEAYHVLSLAQKSEDVTNTAIHNGNSVTFKAGTSGWTTFGQTVTLRTTYKAPSAATVGEEFNSGMAFDPQVYGAQSFDPIDVCVKIRQKDLVESATGSLDGLGFGSVNTGSATITGSVSNPTGSASDFFAGIISGVIKDGS